MDFVVLNEAANLFLSADIDDWKTIQAQGITAVFDLDGEIDAGVPTTPNHLIYVYFPIHDENLPDLGKLQALAELGATLISRGHKVLCHCMMGYNRSALVAGLILIMMGMKGGDVVSLLKEKRPGALYNKRFEAYLRSFPKNE